MSQLSYAPRAPGLPTLGKNAGLMPEFVGNTVETANSLSRIMLKTTLACERLVDDADEIVGIMASTQKQRLLAEMKAAGYELPEPLLA